MLTLILECLADTFIQSDAYNEYICPKKDKKIYIAVVSTLNMFIETSAKHLTF